MSDKFSMTQIVSVRMSDNLYRDMVQVARDYNMTVSEAMRLAAITLATKHRKKNPTLEQKLYGGHALGSKR